MVFRRSGFSRVETLPLGAIVLNWTADATDL